MNELITIPKPKRLEILGPDDLLKVTVRPNPFGLGTRVETVPRGYTCTEIVSQLIKPIYRAFARVYIGGVLVPMRYWPRVRPRKGTDIVVTTTPAGGGGGKNKGGAMALIGALLFVVGFFMPLTWVAMLGTTFVNGMMTVGVGLISAGAMSYTMSMLAGSGPSMSQLSSTDGKTSPTYFINGSRNQCRPWEVVPRIMGSHRVRPAYGAPPYTELCGDDQYLRLLFTVGDGPLEMTDFRIGDTSLSEFDDVEIEVRNGFPGDTPITLYKTTAIETQFSIELSTAFQTRTTPENAEEIIVEIQFPRGLAHIEGGDAKHRAVLFDIDWRPFGSDDDSWKSYDDGTGNRVFEDKTEPFRRAFRWTVSRGQYDVRVRRTNNQSTDISINDQAIWSVLRIFNADPPTRPQRIYYNCYDSAGKPIYNYKGALAQIAMRIKATDQLNNVVDEFSLKARSILMDYGKACLQFNGTHDYLSAGPQPFCATGSDKNRGKHERTFEFMAKPEAQNGGLFQAGRTGVDGGDFSLRILDHTTEEWRINLWGNDIDVVLPGSIGNWHHYGVTVIDGSIRLYYDGTRMALVNISDLDAFDTKSNELEIGRWRGSSYYKGQLREFRVWDKGMRGADLMPLRDASIDTRQDNLLFYWRMNEAGGRTVYDYAGSNHLALSPNPAALHCTFQMEPDDEDGYYWVRLKDIDDYTVQSGDVLEYDIYWPTTGPTNNKIAIEIDTEDNKTLREVDAVDQNGKAADPSTDLSQYTDNKWYCRRISLSALVGDAIENWFIACELNGGGETEAWIKNINVVSSGGTVRRSVWNSGDEKPDLDGDRSSDDDNGYDINVENSDGLVDGPSYVTLDPVPGHWEPRPTSNPASCWRGVIQGANNKRAIATTRLDISRLESWHTRCKTAGRSFNFVFDFASNVLDSLNTVAAVGRASTTMRDGLYSIVEDIAQTVPVQHFTPRNSWDFQGTKDFKEVPHAMRVRYADEDGDNQQSEISAFDDGYSESSAQIYQVLETKGITNKTEAWKWGRYTLAAMRLRPEAFSIMVDVESLVCQRGDLVRLSHDVASIGGGTGRIKQVRLDTHLGGTYVTLDEPVTTEPGKDYSIRIRTASGTSILQPASNTHIEQGETHDLVLSGLLSEIAEGDLWMFGESERETLDCIVSEIVPGDDFTARLLLVPAAPGIYDAENGDIPTYDPFITWDPDATKPVQKPIIQDVITDQRAMLIGADGSYTPQIILALSWESGLYFERADYMQVAIRPSGSQSPFQQALWANVGPCAVIGGVQTRSYDVRVRGVTRLGRASDWTQRTVVVIGDQTPPPDVKQFWAVQQWGGRRRYSWLFADTLPPDYTGVSIRYRAGSDAAWGWSDLDPLHSGLLTGTQYETERPFEAGTYTFAIKAVDRAGNESVNAKIITAQFTSNAGNCCYIQDERANGWNGTRDNCFVNATLGVDKVGELEAIDTSTWDDLGNTTWDTWLAWHTTHLPLTYTTIPITLAEANFVTPLKATIQAAGDGLLTIQARRSFDNGATWGGWYTLPPSGEDSIGTNNTCLWQAKITVAPLGAEQICILREMLVYFETI